MFAEKRAFAILWLGLFFYILGTPSLAAETEPESPGVFLGGISTGTGTLWVEDNGASGYWHSGLRLGIGQNFSMGFDIGQVISNLPWMNGCVLGGAGEFNFNTHRGGVQLHYGFFNHREIGVTTDKVRLSSQGGGGFYAGIQTPLYFGSFSIAPCFYYGDAAWNDGDMYWFFGKPDIPVFMAFGLSLGLDAPPGKIKHGVVFRWSVIDLAILGNENEQVFDAAINGGLFYYSISLEREKTRFSAALGGLYARTAIDGALTSKNQPYFLFPYRFYNINGSVDVYAGFALSGLRLSAGIFQYDINVGVIHLFHNGGDINIHYQMKKLYGEADVYDRITPDIGGIGAAFLLLEGSIPAIPIGRYRLSLGLQKAFILPWGYNKLLSSVTGSPQQEPHTPDTLSLVKSVLLSGLSLRCSLKGPE